MSDMKWTTPQLIVLARGTPEEAVLTVCKQNQREYPNAATGKDIINQTFCNVGDKTCGACTGVTGS